MKVRVYAYGQKQALLMKRKITINISHNHQTTTATIYISHEGKRMLLRCQMVGELKLLQLILIVYVTNLDDILS